MNCIKFIIYGKVQKVFFRKYLSNNLTKAGFRGFVRNLDNGSVELIIKKEQNLNISDILKIINEGSPKSCVESIEMNECHDNLDFGIGVNVKY